MSCNCKVNKQIDYLHRKYGHNIPVRKKTKIKFKADEILRNILTTLLVILFSPFFILHVLYVSLFTKEKSVSMKKMMKLAKVGK